jgi:hypothetical protein
MFGISRKNLTTGAAFFALLFVAAILMTMSGGSPGNAGRAPDYRPSATATGTYYYDYASATPRRTYDYRTLPGTATVVATAVAALPPGLENQGGDKPAERMVLTSGSMRLVVRDPTETLHTITDYVVSIGGYVISGNSTRYLNNMGTEVPRSVLTVRIPAARFEEATAKIKAMAVRVESEEMYGQDVTDEFTDMNSRLKNLESAEAQLRELMNSTKDTDEVLRVFAELTRIRGEIEVIKGRLQQISGEVAYSVLALELVMALPPTITPTPTSTPTPTPIPLWRPVQTALNAATWLGSVGASMVDLLVWMTVIGAPLAVVAVAARRVRRATLPPAPPPEKPDEGKHETG